MLESLCYPVFAKMLHNYDEIIRYFDAPFCWKRNVSENPIFYTHVIELIPFNFVMNGEEIDNSNEQRDRAPFISM